MNVTLSNSKKIKNYLILSFNGICGVGSVGNIDADYIIECLKEELKNDKNLQGVILDFSGMHVCQITSLEVDVSFNLILPILFCK